MAFSFLVQTYETMIAWVCNVRFVETSACEQSTDTLGEPENCVQQLRISQPIAERNCEFIDVPAFFQGRDKLLLWYGYGLPNEDISQI